MFQWCEWVRRIWNIEIDSYIGDGNLVLDNLAVGAEAREIVTE